MVFINLSGTPGELNAVREIGVAMANPVAGPSLEIRSVKLAKSDPGDALLDKHAVHALTRPVCTNTISVFG
jgi:hypothetical protein